MKFSTLKNGQMSLVLALSFLVSCNQDEFYPTEELIAGADAYCAVATDLNSCQQMADICQPAYGPETEEGAEPVFAQCVANPDLWVTPPDGSGSYNEDPVVAEDGSGEDISDPADPVDSAVVPPTIQDAFASKCQNLDAQYLWEKTFVKKNKVVNKMTKVKVCHMTSSGQHTIVIACPALKAHSKHGDYLGACSL